MSRSMINMDEEEEDDMFWSGRGYKYAAESYFEPKSRRDYPDQSIPDLDSLDLFELEMPRKTRKPMKAAGGPSPAARAAQSARDKMLHARGTRTMGNLSKNTRKGNMGNFRAKTVAVKLQKANKGYGVQVSSAKRREKGINVSSYSRSGEEDGILLRGCDVIAEITSVTVVAPAGTETFSQDISPLSFPNSRLKILGGLFQRFRFKNIKFYWEHSCPTTTAGQFLDYVDYDVRDSYSPIDGSFAAVQVASAHKGAKPFGVYEDHVCFFKHDDPLEALFVDQVGESRLYSQGKYHLFVVTPPPVSTACGVLYMQYDLELFQMALQVDAEGGVLPNGASCQTNVASISSTLFAVGGPPVLYAFASAIASHFPDHGANTTALLEDATEDNYSGGAPDSNWQGAYINIDMAIGLRFPRLGRWRFFISQSTLSCPNAVANDLLAASTSGHTTVSLTQVRVPLTTVVGQAATWWTHAVIDVTALTNFWAFNNTVVGTAIMQSVIFSATQYTPFVDTFDSRKSLMTALTEGDLTFEEWAEAMRKRDRITGPHISKYFVKYSPHVKVIEEENEKRLGRKKREHVLKKVRDKYAPKEKEVEVSDESERPHWLTASEGYAPQLTAQEHFKRFQELKERMENTHALSNDTSDDEDSIIEEAKQTLHELKLQRRKRRAEEKGYEHVLDSFYGPVTTCDDQRPKKSSDLVIE